MRRYLWLILILWGAFALRMWHLDTESIWHDEGWSIRAIRGPFTTPDDNTPFLYYFTGHLLWRAGAGESPLAFRYISVLIGIVVVAMAYRLAQRWFGGRWTVLVGILTGISPLLWEYSQEVRAYTAVPLVALGMLAAAYMLLRAPLIPRRAWVFAGLVQLAGLYTHNLSVPLVVWLNLTLGIVWLIRRQWRQILIWAGVEIIVLIGYIPWVLTQSPSGTPLNTPPQLGLNLARDIWASYFYPVLAQLNYAQTNTELGLDTLLPVTVLGLLVTLLTLAWGIQRKQIMILWLLASHAVLVPLFSTLLMIAAHIDFHPRYYIAAVPGTILLLIGGIAALPRRVQYGVVVLILVFYIGLSGFSLYQIRTRSLYQHDDFRGIAQYYATLPADTVILVPFDVERALQDYYVDALNIQAQFINLPLYADEATVIQTLNMLVPRRVEFLTWYQLPADVRGMYPCLLTSASSDVTPPRFYFGLSTQQFYLERPLIPQTMSLQGAYREVTLLDAVTFAPSMAGTCVRTSWRLNQPTADDFSVSATVLNPFGGEITQTDSLITRDDNAGTSDWAVGDSGSAYQLLQLPDGAPLGVYPVRWNIYSPTQLSGLDVLDDAGNPAGKFIQTTVQLVGQQGTFTRNLVQSDSGQQIQTGIPFDVTLRLAPTSQAQTVVALVGDDWTQTQIIDNPNPAGQLAWVRFVVPPGNQGEAVLQVNGEDIAQYTVIDPPRLFDPPDFDLPVGEDFPGVAKLIGASVDDLTVTLVWQAHAPTDIAYTVFVQMLDEDGRVIAQSDAQPSRPTTSWVEGEYIVDVHTLHINVLDYDGETSLIAGFYNPSDFQRVQTSLGETFAQIR